MFSTNQAGLTHATLNTVSIPETHSVTNAQSLSKLIISLLITCNGVVQVYDPLHVGVVHCTDIY